MDHTSLAKKILKKTSTPAALLEMIHAKEGFGYGCLLMLSVNIPQLQADLEAMGSEPATPTRQYIRATETAFLEAKLFGDTSVSTAHILLSVLRNENDPVVVMLDKKHSVNYNRVKEVYSLSRSEKEHKQDNIDKILEKLDEIIKIIR